MREARKQPQPLGLHRHAERPRDHGLRRNDRREGRKNHHGELKVVRDKIVERVARTAFAQNERPLPQIVKCEAREDEREPCPRDRSSTKVPHIRIQGLCSRHRQHNSAEREKCQERFRHDKAESVMRGKRPDDFRSLDDRQHAEGRDHKEPHDHDGPERAAHDARSPPLNAEQGKHKHERDWHDERAEGGRRLFEPLHSRQD